MEETYAETMLPTNPNSRQGEWKVLRVRWRVMDDTLVFYFQDIAEMADDFQPTKRSVISVIGRFYDPWDTRYSCKSSQDKKLSGELLEQWKRSSIS